MNAIEGIDLGEVTRETLAAYQDAQKAKLRERIVKLLDRRRTSTESILALHQQITKYEQKIADVNGKLTALEEGKWSILDSDLPRVVVGNEVPKSDED